MTSSFLTIVLTSFELKKNIFYTFLSSNFETSTFGKEKEDDSTCIFVKNNMVLQTSSDHVHIERMSTWHSDLSFTFVDHKVTANGGLHDHR